MCGFAAPLVPTFLLKTRCFNAVDAKPHSLTAAWQVTVKFAVDKGPNDAGGGGGGGKYEDRPRHDSRGGGGYGERGGNGAKDDFGGGYADRGGRGVAPLKSSPDQYAPARDLGYDRRGGGGGGGGVYERGGGAGAYGDRGGGSSAGGYPERGGYSERGGGYEHPRGGGGGGYGDGGPAYDERGERAYAARDAGDRRDMRDIPPRAAPAVTFIDRS